MFRLNLLIPLAAVALILKALLDYNPPATTLKVGDTAPDFTIKTVGGKSVGLSDLKGNPSVLFFYAGWCPCSNESAHQLNMAYRDFAKKGVNFVGIGFQDKKNSLSEFAVKHNIPFPVGFDLDQSVARNFGVSTPPTTIFLSGDGKVLSIFVGKIKKYGELLKEIETLEIQPGNLIAKG